jgi:hypothetical protein
MLNTAAVRGSVEVLNWLGANEFVSAENCRRSGAVMNAIAGAISRRSIGSARGRRFRWTKWCRG